MENKSASFAFVLLCILCLQSLCSAVIISQEGDENVSSTIDISNNNSNSFRVHRLDTNRPPMQGSPRKINLYWNEETYGYLGDAVVPHYPQTTPPSANYKWRVVCRRPNRVFMVLLGLNMTDGSYLQIRKRAFTGVATEFHAYDLKLTSVLVSHVKNEPTSNSSFRMAYICIEPNKVFETNLFLLQRDVLDYIQTREDGIEKVLATIENRYNTDPVVREIVKLAGL